MFDISGPIGPSQPTPEPAKPAGPGGAKPPEKEEPTSEFMGMQVTKEQKEKIYASLCNSVIQDMKTQDARAKKANENLRRSMEGKPLEP